MQLEKVTSLKNTNETFEMIAKTLHGLEEITANELRQIGAEDVTVLKRAVKFKGDKNILYKSNVYLRTAIKILKPVCTFETKSEDTLYKEVGKIDWSEYLGVNDTLAVDGVVSSPYFNHSLYVALKTKDAIVDQFRRIKGLRPSVNVENPTIRINVHISDSTCNILLDSSGDALYKRGYRKNRNIAPLNEVLAAGMILLTGWDGSTQFVDPMCGSGTLPIEAALIAYNIPPGIYRNEFGFEKWKDFDAELFREIMDEIPENIERKIEITGNDISIEFINFARENAKNALMQNKIKFSCKPIEEFIPGKGNGVAIMNPPYGERMHPKNIQKLYAKIGERIKHHYTNYDVWILSSNADALLQVGLRPSRKFTLFNGDLECKFLKFSIYQGSKKASKNPFSKYIE